MIKTGERVTLMTKKMKDQMLVAKRLRAVREKMNMKVCEISRHCGVAASLWSSYEKGRIIPGMKVANRICNKLKIPVEKLFGMTEKEESKMPEATMFRFEKTEPIQDKGEDNKYKGLYYRASRTIESQLQLLDMEREINVRFSEFVKLNNLEITRLGNENEMLRNKTKDKSLLARMWYAVTPTSWTP